MSGGGDIHGKKREVIGTVSDVSTIDNLDGTHEISVFSCMKDGYNDGNGDIPTYQCTITCNKYRLTNGLTLEKIQGKVHRIAKRIFQQLYRFFKKYHNAKTKGGFEAQMRQLEPDERVISSLDKKTSTNLLVDNHFTTKITIRFKADSLETYEFIFSNGYVENEHKLLEHKLLFLCNGLVVDRSDGSDEMTETLFQPQSLVQDQTKRANLLF